MADESCTQVSKVARVKRMIKKPWISVKSKLKNTRRVKQVDIDPVPDESAPAPQGTAPSVDLSTSEDTHTLVHSICIDPPRSGLSSLPGLQELKDSLLVSSASKQATTDDAHPSALLDHAPQVIAQPETAPQRQGSASNDSVRSDEAVFGDSQNLTNGTIRIAPNQPNNPPVEITAIQKAPAQVISARTPRPRLAPVQLTPVQNVPAQVRFPLMSQIENKVQVPKLAIPVPTPARPIDMPLQYPGVFSPSLTPSPQIKLLGLQNAQQKTPLTPANLFLSPSPMAVVQALGSKPPTPTTPNTPIMPHTPTKHQDRIPEVIGQTQDVVANQPPPLLPRSPRRPPRLVPVPIGENNFGVIGDHRVSRNEPQPQVAVESRGKPEIKEDVPLVKLEPTQASGEVDSAPGPEDRNSSSSEDPRPIFVGEQKYYVGRHLGGGGMGRVYSVVSGVTMSLSALKVTKRKNLDWDCFSTVKSEWAILKAISEAKFVYPKRVEGLQFVHHLMESWYDKDHIYFVMPLCVGSLRENLRFARFDSLTIRVYAAELMCGLEALHDMRIMHCDLKPENILIYPNGHLSIADFGLSVSWLDPRYKSYPSHAFRGRRLAGTEGYMAPELVYAFQDPGEPRRGNFGFAADIWSMGVIIAELGMGGRRLVSYEDEGERGRWEGDYTSFARNMVLSREKMVKRVRRHLHGDHAMLVERMIEFNEASRPDFDEIALHPFFSDLDIGNVLRRAYPVPIPPFELALPCRHTCIGDFWLPNHDGGEQQDGAPPDDVAEHDEMRALCFTRDMDRHVIPEDFVWNLDKAVRLAMGKAR